MASSITKTQVIEELAEEKGLTKTDTKAVVDGLLDLITNKLEEEAVKPEDERKPVRFVGFGQFEVRDRSARVGRNPQTGESIEIPARTVPKFKAGKTLKDQVNVK